MGVFDTLFVNCPGCGAELEFQSKTGHSTLARYRLNEVPEDVMYGLENERKRCPHCSRTVYLRIVRIPEFLVGVER